LLEHEEVRTDKADALLAYVETHRGPPTLPAIVACSRTNVIIDGHHRHMTIRRMGFSLCPVLYVDYEHADILVHTDPAATITKQAVIDAAVSHRLLEPKSTKHVLLAGNGEPYPIVTISPTCCLADENINLTGGWSYTPAQKKRIKNSSSTAQASPVVDVDTKK
jgi:hypothetical protein